MAMAGQWKCEIQAGHACLSLLAPPVNALGAEVLEELAVQLKRLEERDTRTLLLHSRLPGYFSAGADLKLLKGAGPLQAQAFCEAFYHSFEALRRFSGVTLAVLEGRALGGGLELALACDLRLATPDASLGLPEARLGLLPCAGGTQLLPRLVGLGRARQMIFTGAPVSANEALNMGLVNGIHPAQEIYIRAQALLADVRKAEPGAVLACKQLLNYGASQPLNQGYAEECAAFIKLFSRQAPQQGVQAFFTKQLPPWHNE